MDNKWHAEIILNITICGALSIQHLRALINLYNTYGLHAARARAAPARRRTLCNTQFLLIVDKGCSRI